jgi:hypothetical protein
MKLAIIGIMVIGIGIVFLAGMVVIAKGCEDLNEHIKKGY